MEASGAEMMKRSRECVPQELRSCHGMVREPWSHIGQKLTLIRVLTQTSMKEGRICTIAKLVSIPVAVVSAHLC